MRNAGRLGLAWMALAIGLIQKSAADEVLDWNAVFNQAIVKSSYASALSFRQAAIVHVSMFDAVNGIERHRQPIHVTELAPKGASRRAAVIQAAYASMLNLFPNQKELLDGQMEASLAALADDDDEGAEGNSVVRGLAWGQHVADLIWAWRSTDGYDPSPSTYTGSTDVGQWRPTPPAYAPALFVPRPLRPPPPPELTSAQYTADFNEVKAVGSASSTVRTADQTQAALFWAGPALTFWNRVAADHSVRRHLTAASFFDQLGIVARQVDGNVGNSVNI